VTDKTTASVVVTCGRSQVYGELMREDAAAWYVRHEGAAFAKQYRKDEWSLAPTNPDPKSSDAGSALVSLLLAVCIVGGLLGLLALGQAAMCATHTTPGERPVYCEPTTEGGER
jgi:hypothetical protein